jgi:tRNA modification GTPase
MNALLGKERAIVSPLAGTTRDIIEDELRLNGYHIRLLDTAGIRATDEMIEGEGIKRSWKAIERSDLILAVLDVTRPDCCETMSLLKTLPPGKTIAVWNKIDLPHERPLPQVPFHHVVELSCSTQQGLDALHQEIDRVVLRGVEGHDELVITSLRHKEALGRAIQLIDCVAASLQGGGSPEFVALDLRGALYELGSIIGTDVTEDILTAVFSTFCIGK